MNNPIARVYHVFLDADELALDIQQRILAYGSRVKDTHLLARLASHPALTPELDDRLREIELAEVKAAWAGRPGRSAAELVKLVDNEKRVKVLTALAERQDLPSALYEQIAKKAKGQAALFALASNTAAETSARHTAASRLAAMFVPGSVSGGAETRKVSDITHLVGNSPELADVIVLNTSNQGAIGACAAATALSPEAQLHIAEVSAPEVDQLIARYTNGVNNRYFSWYSHGWLSSVAESMAEHGDLDPVAGEKIITMLERLHEAANSDPARRGVYTEFSDAATKLRSALDKPRVDMLALASAAQTPEAVEHVLNEIDKRSRGYARFSTTGAVVVALVNNPATTIPQVQRLVSTHLSWSSRNLFSKLTSDPMRVAAVASEMLYWEIDTILDRSSDPKASFAHLLTLCVESGRKRVPLEVLQSKYFSEEHIGKLQLAITGLDDLPVNVMQEISAYLTAHVASDEAWAMLETLGHEFEGTIEDLVRMVNTI